MKSFKYNIYIFIIISIFWFISALDNSGPLKSTSINPIDQFEDGIYYNNFEIQVNTDNYFSYDLKRHKSESNIVMTISGSSILTNIDLKCIYSNSNEDSSVIEQFEDSENICSIYKHKNNKVINLISPLSGYQEGDKLFLKIKVNSDTNYITLNFYVRENSYQTGLNTQEIQNAFSYIAFEFNKANYFQNQFLLSSSLANSILIFGEKNEEICQMDETSVVGVSEQSLAAHFWDFENIIIFVGKTEKSENNEENIVNFEKTDINEENKRIYYYTGDKDEYYKSYISFHYDCKDDSTINYLIVNYGNLSEKDLYFKFHNLIGSKAFSAEFPQEENDITNLNFEEIQRLKYLAQTNYHINVFKLECSGDGNKIVANINYNITNDLVDNCIASYKEIKDCNHTFNSGENLKVDYSDILSSNQTEFTIQIITLDTSDTITFEVNFEKQTISMDNQSPTIFKIKNKEINELTIVNDNNIKTVISVSPAVKTEENNSSTKYLQINYLNKNNKNYYIYYKLEHEFNTNYHLDLEIKNPNDFIIPICYYLSITSLIHNFGQNCFLLPAKENKNITFKNIFKSSDKNENEFNLEEPQYTVVIYNNHNNDFDYKFNNLYLTTDLLKSKPINKFYNDHFFLFEEEKLEENIDAYFNLYLEETEEENHIDLYISDDVSEFTELKFDVQCITAYEVAIEFIKPYFKEENNICHIINKKDYKSNVFHIIFNYTYHISENLIIKVIPKKSMNIKLVIDRDEFVRKDFDFNEATYIIEEPSVYKIYEIDKESFKSNDNKKIMLYNKDDLIEFYGRIGNNFIQIYKSSLILLDSSKITNQFNTYLFIFGRNNCTYYCDSNLKYQLKFIENLFYDLIQEFDEYHRFIININNCSINEPYYIIFDYGRKYLEEAKSLAFNTFWGNVENSYYIDTFTKNEFDYNKKELNNYQKINENDLHANIIIFECKNSLFAYFDYFRKIDNETTIQLNKYAVNYYNLQKNNNFTFDYISIDEIKIDLLEENIMPSIYFEKNEVNIEKEKSIILSRKEKNINQFYLISPEKSDIAVRITTLIYMENLDKTEIENLYQIDNMYIYDIPEKALNLTIKIERVFSSRLRLLTEENENGIEICYNAANFIILDKISNNCFNVKESYDLKYIVLQSEENSTKSYIILYAKEEDQKFFVKSVELYIEGGDNDKSKSDGNNNDDQNKKKEDKDDNKKKSSKGLLIVIIIILVFIVLVVIILMVLGIRKKRVTSKDIEKSAKDSTRAPYPMS